MTVVATPELSRWRHMWHVLVLFLVCSVVEGYTAGWYRRSRRRDSQHTISYFIFYASVIKGRYKLLSPAREEIDDSRHCISMPVFGRAVFVIVQGKVNRCATMQRRNTLHWPKCSPGNMASHCTGYSVSCTTVLPHKSTQYLSITQKV